MTSKSDLVDRLDTLDLRRVRPLGAGHSSQVYLTLDSTGRKYAEKVRQSSGFAKFMYKISVQAPTPDRNEDAVIVAVLTRKLLDKTLWKWNGEDERIPLISDAIGYRWCKEEQTYSILTEYIDGRGPKPNTEEMDTLIECMDALQEKLFEAGLYGPAWQADTSNMTSTANFKISGDGRLHWIDTEPGMCAVALGRGKKYIKMAKKKGLRPLFADIDFDKLEAYIIQEGFQDLDGVIDDLKYHMHEWKSSEIAWRRKSVKSNKEKIRKWYVENWKYERSISDKKQEKLKRNGFAFYSYLLFGKPASFIANKKFREHTFENKFKELERKGVVPRGYRKHPYANYLLWLIFPKVIHHYIMDHVFRRYVNKGFLSREHRKHIARDFIFRGIDEWEDMQRLSESEAKDLRELFSTKDDGLDVYLAGFGAHLLMKGPTVAGDIAGIANILGTSGFAFLEPLTIEPLLFDGLPWPLNSVGPFLFGPILRVTYVGYSALRCKLEGRKVPHKTAAIVSFGKIGIGTMAFLAQIGVSEHKFVLEYFMHKIGNKFPVFGGTDSRVEHAFIRLPSKMKGF